jgi:hypothetical protein
LRPLRTVARRPLVLSIEDDPWIQAVASELLEDEGYATASSKTRRRARMPSDFAPQSYSWTLGYQRCLALSSYAACIVTPYLEGRL